MKKIYRYFSAVLCLMLLMLLAPALYIQSTIPDNYYVVEGEPLKINTSFDIQAQTNSRSYPTDVYDVAGNSYTVDLKMMGLVHIKEVSVSVVNRRMVIPCGTPFGIKMFTDGVMVVGMEDFQINGSPVNPAKSAGICIGDIIVKMNGQSVFTNEDVGKIISESGGKAVDMVIKRKNVVYEFSLQPVKNDTNGSYKAGIWVRDSSAGIGTMTYYDPSQMTFGGLGHAICDVDTGDIMPLYEGEIVGAKISGVTAGISGTPGELRGSFIQNSCLGELKMNNQTGVYGTLSGAPSTHKAIPLAQKHEVKTGEATILTTISGDQPEEYKILIEKVNFSDATPTKNLVIKIIDEELLDISGGIVQGMSGSPIIQNGQLVGAVTHVFVNDPTRGYGIFAENMDKTMKNVTNGYKKAS